MIALLLAATLSAGSLTATFSPDRGCVTSLRGSDGAEFAAGPKEATALFVASLTREDNFTNTLSVTPWQAGRVELSETNGSVRLVFGAFPAGLKEVVCEIVPRKDELVWNIGFETAPSWLMHDLAYPRIALTSSIRRTGEDDAIVMGNSKGGVRRNPSARACGTEIVSGRQPGELSAQFGCFYDADNLFYTAADDVRGEPKRLAFLRPESPRKGVVASWSWQLFAGGRVRRPFAVRTAALCRSGAALSWHDAADRYRAWAEANAPWCAKKIAERDDLPGWMKDAPILARIPDVGWFRRPERTRDWVRAYSHRLYPDAPLILALWGWEKVDAWIGPDYFPCVPDDETFARLVRDCRALGAHAYPWPSGYHWTRTFGPETNGVWRWDGRALYDVRGVAAHATLRRNGQPHHSKLSWLEGGEAANLCPWDPWTQTWWNEEVCLPLARLGCEMIQVDQVVSGYCPTCYSTKHGHRPGEGPWRWEMFERQLRTMRETMRTVEPDAVISVEEPQELFTGIVGLCDYRDCEAVADEWAGVYNYLYHEYAPVFQSNARRGNRIWQAFQVVEGQMPFFRCAHEDWREDFRPTPYDRFMRAWIDLWRGAGRKYLFLARRIKPPEIRCATQHYHSEHWDGVYDGPRPCVFGGAFRAADGHEALIFANATDRPQTFTYAWRGKTVSAELAADGIRMEEQ